MKHYLALGRLLEPRLNMSTSGLFRGIIGLGVPGAGPEIRDIEEIEEDGRGGGEVFDVLC